ncbi:bifunctional nicotinamidase/pyrazinamidase [Pontibacter harenae]|uniref:bifunctional nicotinamidase/pyrazinamidase n=1 Tax=Pontibacter harenae TaxID=2894083 RepID=UPI001E50BABA|nr:bifunctional nicotinamidase/pyrazinamidase [Pontibacter harenae]MCC9168838.1 bifunctional nicotinamidase/pyrazinamidase [Pontibacter harenae]
MKALLLIDIQNDFLPSGALAVPEGGQVIPIANQLQQHFDLVVATQDWHPQNHKSFSSQHTAKQPFDVIDLYGLEQVLWPDHCVQGSVGAEFSKELNMHKVAAIFRKGTNAEVDSYSGFYDNGHRISTALSDYLRGKAVTEVYLAGLAGDYCVYFSAKDALQEGFAVYLIDDACRPISPEGYQKAKEDIVSKGGKVINSSEIIG